MLSYPLVNLSQASMTGLRNQQDKVDAKATHRERVNKATELFKGKTPAAAFREVKESLAAASPNGEACFYCERDRYRDIEHIQPKRHHPNRAFDWFNYVYACAICNQDAKRDKFAVFVDETSFLEIDRTWPIDDPVPDGEPVLIDVRVEDPLEFLKLDFQTGSLISVELDNKNALRANYTRDLFELDAADLTRIRRNFVGFYLMRCKEYVDARRVGAEQRAKLILDDILEMEHPTVIVELRRQAPEHPALQELFAQLPPEVGSWPPHAT